MDSQNYPKEITEDNKRKSWAKKQIFWLNSPWWNFWAFLKKTLNKTLKFYSKAIFVEEKIFVENIWNISAEIQEKING